MTNSLIVRRADVSTSRHNNGLRAAQYVRMSTELQRYSAEIQAAAIASYAVRRNLTIVRTYVDRGRSGLRITGREALQRLINDVRDGRADFDFILVYDVSRWGRFQDVDESAYYEFICKRAGIQVLYCAEQFENDGSLLSTMVKNIKRVMAAEYSRELSAKVFAGSCRMIQLGFKQGGTPGYGLQRMLVGANLTPKGFLAPGEQKRLQTDRVILQPGQAMEVAIVRQIFCSFVIKRQSEFLIARELNEQSILNEFGRPWSRNTVQRLLTSEKYIGNYVYNRVSSKLKQRKTENPPDLWIRAEGAFTPIVQPAIFEAARNIIASRRPRTVHAWPSNDEILVLLKALLKQKGRLSCKIIDKADGLPCSALYTQRFGGVSHAYELVGYDAGTCKRFEARRSVISAIDKLGKDLVAKIVGERGSADFDGVTRVLRINNALTVSMFVARCQRMRSGSLRWNIRRPIDPSFDLVLAARMDEDNDKMLDYVLVPTDKMPDGRISFWKKDRARFDPYRFRSLDQLVRPIWRALLFKLSGLPHSEPRQD